MFSPLFWHFNPENWKFRVQIFTEHMAPSWFQQLFSQKYFSPQWWRVKSVHKCRKRYRTIVCIIWILHFDSRIVKTSENWILAWARKHFWHHALLWTKCPFIQYLKIFWRESGAAICNCQNPHWLCTGQTLRINCGKTKVQVNYSAIFPVPTMFNWFSIQILRHNSQPLLLWSSSQIHLLMENRTSQHMAMFWLFHQLSIPPFTENERKIHIIWHVQKKTDWYKHRK